jgi:hypothetical protein
VFEFTIVLVFWLVKAKFLIAVINLFDIIIVILAELLVKDNVVSYFQIAIFKVLISPCRVT